VGDGTNWLCRYLIDWPDGPIEHYGRGIDAVQAALLALKMIGAELYTSSYHERGELRWEKAGEGYGFPVPKNIRNLLVGEDRKFDG
jgi:hypothetical protein